MRVAMAPRSGRLTRSGCVGTLEQLLVHLPLGWL